MGEDAIQSNDGQRALDGSRAAFGFVAGTAFLDALSFGLAFPVAPRLVLDLNGGHMVAAAQTVGAMAAAWAAASFIAAPILGALSDRFGRRPIILLATLGLAVDMVVMAMAPSVAWLFVGRVVAGLTAASYSTASAYVADVSSPERRTQRFGLLSALYAIGMVLGPAAGGLLGQIGPRAPFWVAAGIAALGWLYGLVVLPESLPPSRRAQTTPLQALIPARSLGILSRSAPLLTIAAVMLVFQVAAQAVNSTFVLYTGYRYGWTTANVGVFLTVFSIGLVLVTAIGAPLAAKLVGERVTVLLGIALAAAGMVALGLAPSGWVFCLAAIPACLGNLSGPALQSLATARIAEAEQGQLQGALAAIASASSLVGPLMFTQVFAWSIGGAVAPSSAGYALFAAAGMMATAWLLAVARVRATSVSQHRQRADDGPGEPLSSAQNS